VPVERLDNRGQAIDDDSLAGQRLSIIFISCLFDQGARHVLQRWRA